MELVCVGDRVTPLASDLKLGSLHGIEFIVISVDTTENVIIVLRPGFGKLSGTQTREISYTRPAEPYCIERFQLLSKETVEERIKKLYRKYTTTRHWG